MYTFREGEKGEGLLGVIDAIRERWPSLSRKQSLLAKFIVDHGREAALMNASQIGAATGTSEATVTRFAYALGYGGFAPFQLALRREMQAGHACPAFRFEKREGERGSVWRRVFDVEASLMEETLALIDGTLFERFVDGLVGGSHLFLVASSPGDFLALYGFTYFRLLRDNVHLVTSLDLPFLGNLEGLRSATALVFCYPRYPRETLRLAEALADGGVRLLGLTDSQLSPLVPLVDEVLLTPHRYVTFVDPQAAALTLVHALLVALFERDRRLSEERLARYEKAADGSDFFAVRGFSFAEALREGPSREGPTRGSSPLSEEGGKDDE